MNRVIDTGVGVHNRENGFGSLSMLLAQRELYGFPGSHFRPQ